MRLSGWYPYLVAAGVILADRLSKFWIESKVNEWDRIVVIPGLFQIVHTRNTGIAFGLFQGSGGASSPILVVFSVLIMGLIGWMLWSASRPGSTEPPILKLALGFVLGGAAGNLYDRVWLGSVTDFFDFYWQTHHFPIFNVADSAITIGAGLLLLSLWTKDPSRS